MAEDTAGKSNHSEALIAETLRRMPALDLLADDALQDLARISRIDAFDPGDTIIAEGSYGGWIYYLLSGKVRIVKRGREMASLQRIGDLFGEMGVIDYGMRSASVQAVTAVSCLRINLAHIDRLPTNNRYAFRYTLYRGFAEALAQRLRVTTEKYLATKEALDALQDRTK
ncbi:MAG: cyclic nucleotide-binding domain-containing protein [Desulfosarcinaceae bacterium]|nr:cyclic nucleotide-binding domain-containing protein [Desulfosarcinaceae bacterium]